MHWTTSTLPFTAKAGVKIVSSYGASSVLAQQIEQGGPVDIFVSADTDWMDYAVQKKTIKENLLANSLVLIAPKISLIDKVTIEPGFDLAKLASERQDRDRRRERWTGRQIRQVGAREARCVERR
jgi:molybdate transport system substrate-binding protein